MSASSPALQALKPLADLQSGVVTREQATAHGVSPRVVARLLDEGHWCRLEPGLFLTTGVEPTFGARAWAGTLLGGDASRVGGLAAARLHGFNDDEPTLVTVLVPHQRRPAPRRGYEFVRGRLGVRGRSVGAPPRTTVEDTVLDLCVTAAAEDVVGWVTLAVERRRTTSKRLRRALQARDRHPRRELLEGLLADVAVGVRSPLELTYLRDVERAHGLSALVSRQRPSRDHKAVRDIWYVEFGVVVELDGRLGHTELGRFRDMDRDCAVLLAPAYALTLRSSSRARRQRSEPLPRSGRPPRLVVQTGPGLRLADARRGQGARRVRVQPSSVLS